MLQLPPWFEKPQLSPVYILEDPRESGLHLFLPGRRKERPGGELLTETPLPQVVLQFQRVSNSFKQLHKTCSFHPCPSPPSKTNFLGAPRVRPPHPGSLFQLPSQNQEPSPVLRQNPVKGAISSGWAREGLNECQVRNTGINLLQTSTGWAGGGQF